MRRDLIRDIIIAVEDPETTDSKNAENKQDNLKHTHTTPIT